MLLNCTTLKTFTLNTNILSYLSNTILSILIINNMQILCTKVKILYVKTEDLCRNAPGFGFESLLVFINN